MLVQDWLNTFFKSTSRLFVMYILQSQTIIVMEKYDVLVSESNHTDLISQKTEFND